MSLGRCIPEMIERGEIDAARGARMKELFDRLEARYRQSMAPDAAAAEASEQTLVVLGREAALKKRQTLLQVAAQSRAAENMKKFKSSKPKARSAALALFDRDWQGRAPYQNVEELRKSLLGQAHAMMDGVLDRYHRGFLTGMIRNKAELVQLAREAFGEASGNPMAKALADAWTETAEFLRMRFNAAGGDIARLVKWGFPQHHDSRAVRGAADELPLYRSLEARLQAARAAGDAAEETRVGNAMIEVASQTWREFVKPRLDRERMIDAETGMPFDDAALDAALDGVFRTIRTEGWEGRSLGVMGGAKLANRHGDHRFLIFRDADSWLEYQDRFGSGTVYDAMMGHLERMSRDIAHLEILGPNPSATVKWLSDLVEQQRQVTPDSKVTGQAPKGFFIGIEEMYASTSGALSAPVNPRVAEVMGSVRSTLVAAQLGSAMLSAVTDVGWTIMARIHRGLPVTGTALDLARMFTKAERREAVRTGLIAEEASRLLAAQNRYADEVAIGSKAAWLAERTMKLSMLAPWTQAGKWAFGRGMASTMGSVADRPLEQVPRAFQRMLREYGVDGAAWDKIRATSLRDDGFLEPIDIADPHLRDRVLGMVLTETDAAVPSVTATGRAILQFGQRPGSLGGEMLKSIGQYKSFGATLMLMQGGRVLGMKASDRLAYIVAANVICTTLGVFSIWLRDIRNGEDPSPLNVQTLGRGWLQGTGFGPFGDFLKASTSERTGTLGETVAGPLFSLLSDVGQFTVGNAAQALTRLADGPELKRDGTPKSWNEELKLGRESVNMAKRYNLVPGTNLWYSRIASERLLFDQMQMLFDPGYEDSWKAIARAHAEEGREAWWERGAMTPSRAPDWDNVIAGD